MKKYDFAVLKGVTIVEIVVTEDKQEIHFMLDTGRVFKMKHFNECQEDVYIEDICGDLKDLLNTPILIAEQVPGGEESTGQDWELLVKEWTFYKLDTIKGGVTIRWEGTSNGHYSVAVDLITE